LAGLRAAEALRRAGHDGPLTIVGAETHRPYDRPPLSKQILTGKAQASDTALRVDDDLEIEWQLGVKATGLDLDRRRVLVSASQAGPGDGGGGGGGDDVPFDRLIIATGAHPRVLRGLEPGPGVHYLRTIDDAVALRDDLARAERAVVIGAGFIGLEVAASAHQRGVDVTVLEALPVPLERAVGAEMGAAIAAMHRRHGVDVQVNVGVEELVGAGRVEGVRLAGGTVIPADLVVVGIGVAPTTGWLEGSGIDLADGVVSDERLRVLVGGHPRPDIVAVGDVARWRHAGYG
jgi:NADPH-dependent 2,4-dienoyl-CoA reductase/sulfur reductase-like enzyme